MQKFIFILGLLLIIISPMQAQQKINSRLKLVNPNAPVITFEKVIHDFGELEYKGNGKCIFKFKNTGREPLILSKPKSSCGCAVPTWPKQPILPGQSGEISVKYDSKKVGKIKKTITVKSNAKNKAVVLKLKGLVKKKNS